MMHAGPGIEVLLQTVCARKVHGPLKTRSDQMRRHQGVARIVRVIALRCGGQQMMVMLTARAAPHCLELRLVAARPGCLELRLLLAMLAEKLHLQVLRMLQLGLLLNRKILLLCVGW